MLIWQKYIVELVKYGSNAISRSKYDSGNTSLDDSFHSDQPIELMEDAHARIKMVIRTDRRVKIREIADKLAIFIFLAR